MLRLFRGKPVPDPLPFRLGTRHIVNTRRYRRVQQLVIRRFMHQLLNRRQSLVDRRGSQPCIQHIGPVALQECFGECWGALRLVPGEKVSESAAIGTAGVGRWNDDLLNQQSATTGSTYTPQDVNTPTPTPGVANVTTGQAMNTIDQSLARGDPVPVVVGNQPGGNSHYVVVTGHDTGSPPGYTVHDPGTGTTTTVPRSDMENSTMNAGGYSTLNAIEAPTPAP